MRVSRRALALVLVSSLGCQRVPRPLEAGVDACEFCRMTISDVRFGGEIQSRAGRLHAFDSAECLASYYLDAESRNDVRAAWVSDFDSGRLVPVDSAVFLEDSRISSPMGRRLVAFAPGAVDIEQRLGGRIRTWSDVLTSFRGHGLQPGAQAHDTAPPSPPPAKLH